MTAGYVFFLLSCWQAQTFYFGMNQNFLKTPASGVSNYLTAHPHYKTAPGSRLSACRALDRNQGVPHSENTGII